MGFRINTNIAAMNAHMYAQRTNLGLDKSLASLSSGLRINKAADDASGMAIADSLKQQAQGLSQAINNANDGIGVVQTADGALDEYINIVNTIRTKAIQAASDGQNSDSRAAIQRDIDRLLEEAQNIAATTSFNGQTLLNGGYQDKFFHIGAYSGETVSISIDNAQTDNVSQFALLDGTGTVGTGGTGGTTIQLTATDVDGVSADSGAVAIASGATALQAAQSVVDKFNADAQEAGADLRASVIETSTGYSVRIDSSDDISGGAITDGTAGSTAAIAATASEGTTNTLDTIDVSTRANAEKAIIITDYALKELDAVRSDIGSVQNQLESTIRNISVTQVNVQAAESQIRDVDFAAESANFSKLNILAQSGSYAMSQANAVQQNVLRLLQ
jgi:flagellin